MNPLNLMDVRQYVEENIETFHQKRLEKLEELKSNGVLKSKNPYLFKAKNVLNASALVKGIVDAYLSSSEEGIFGDWLERLALFVNEKVYQGRKSSTAGIDLEFDKDGVRYIVAIKSGPDWANGGQIKDMIKNFDAARKTLRTSGANINVIAVNGCCYGRTYDRFKYKEKGDYYKLYGQAFREFISGDSDLYKEIIVPIGYKADEKNEAFRFAYEQKLNLFTLEFTSEFCKETGEIDWDKLVEFNSEQNRKITRRKKTDK